jgi:hypothetical protein
MYYLGTAVIALIVGFAFGRVKNHAKLAAVTAYVAKVEADLKSEALKVGDEAKTEIAKLVVDIKAKL